MQKIYLTEFDLDEFIKSDNERRPMDSHFELHFACIDNVESFKYKQFMFERLRILFEQHKYHKIVDGVTSTFPYEESIELPLYIDQFNYN